MGFLFPPDGPNPLLAMHDVQAQAMELVLQQAGVSTSEISAVRNWTANLLVGWG